MKKIFLSLSAFLCLNAEVITTNIKEYDFSNKDYILVDVRMPEEYAKTGVVDGAKLITVLYENGLNPNFIQEMNDNFKKDSKIAIMCKSGKRSAMAAKMLEDDGFTNIINLDGGMNELLKTNIKLVPYKN